MRRPLYCLIAFLLADLANATEVRLRGCSNEFGPTAQCAQVSVPEDRAATDGRQINLQVIVLPSRGDKQPEPMVLFPGGPGQAVPTLLPIATQLYPGVQDNRDIVLVGQRGSGQSNPMNCLQDIATDPQLLFGALWNREGIAECWQRTQSFADPQHYTTGDYVADVIDVLDRLGYDKIVIWGGSGGTRIAQAFIREAPERVVAAALDGVTPIDYAMPLPFARFVQRSWDRVVADCEAQPDCAEAYPDLDADLNKVFEAVASGPVTVTIKLNDRSSAEVPLSAGDIAYSLRGNLYNPNGITQLPKNVHHAATSGDLSFFAQSLYNRSAGMLSSGVIAVGLHITQYCAEDVHRIEDAAVEVETANTFVGTYVVDEYRGACDHWPVVPVSDDWYRDWQAQTPTLMISGYYDPSTPAESAELVRKHLPNSKHLMIRNVSHGAGFGCAQSPVQTFLQTASLDGVENACPDQPVQFNVETSN